MNILEYALLTEKNKNLNCTEEGKTMLVQKLNETLNKKYHAVCINIGGMLDTEDNKIAKYCEQQGVSFLGIHQIKYPLTQEKKELYNTIRSMTNSINLALVTQEQDTNKLLKLCSECDWDYIQLHFKITPQDIVDLRKKLHNMSLHPGIISVVDIGDIENYDVDMLSKVSDFLLFDSSIRGGTGIPSSMQALKKIKQIANGKDFFIAGGLNDKNVLDTIKTCEPYAVDVQSGAEFLEPELKHRKDPRRIKSFVNAVKTYNKSSINNRYSDNIEELEI